MPYVSNDGVRIAYAVTGQGPAVVLAHGGTSSMAMWAEGPYVDALAASYTVIRFDARGHGQSDAPHDVAAYDETRMARDVLAVLDAAGVARAHYWGYSMGGWIGFQLAAIAPERLRSLILGGTGPQTGPRAPDTPADGLLGIMRAGVEGGPDVVVAGIREVFGPISPEYEARLRQLDYQAMAALMEHADDHAADQRSIPPTITVPCLVYMSEQDDPGFAETMPWVNQIPNATFVPIGGSHVDGDPAAEVAAVLAFLDNVERQA
jgi:pimeloyl-ACP methyl ester carboxylesterase